MGTEETDLTGNLNSIGRSIAEGLVSVVPGIDAQDEKDRFFLQLAKFITMQSGGRAEEYLDHFLSGAGTPKHFDIGELIATDNGVGRRLKNEVIRRVLGIKTVREKLEDSKYCASRETLDERRIITIFQKNYEVQDWQYALGTFPFNWKVVGYTGDKKSIFVTVSGTNEYKWHPKDKRITQFLHEAGDRLSKTPRQAKNFDMVAKPITIKVSTLNREILELVTVTQTNPRNASIVRMEDTESWNETSNLLKECNSFVTEMYSKLTRWF